MLLLLLDLDAIFHDLGLDHPLDTETRAERTAAVLHMQVRVVERMRSGMPEFRRAPARPWQTVIVAADIGQVGRSAQRYQVELVLVLHMRLEALRRLTAIAGGPSATIDFAQHVFCDRQIVLDLDVLEHQISEAELFREEIHHFEIVFQFENRLDDLFAPLDRAVG